MPSTDCPEAESRVQVRLTVGQIRAIFSAINTAGTLSAGRIRRVNKKQTSDLMAAIDTLEKASGADQAEEDEWLLD